MSDTNTTTTESTVVEGVAIGRSGQISQRKEFAGMHFGVDVQRNEGNPRHQEGVVSRAFKTEAAAQKFADRINSGEFEGSGNWYDTAHDAIVVPVWPTPAEGQPWPWETTAGKRALEQARGGKVTAKPSTPAKRGSKANPAA